MMYASKDHFRTDRPVGAAAWSSEDARRALRRGFLPELEPAQAARPVARAAVPPSAQDEPTDFRDRAESRDPVARLTVYALNAAVMLFFFPLGMALLIFNILGGENLRTTAHALALTGLGTAIAATGQAGILLSLL